MRTQQVVSSQREDFMEPVYNLVVDGDFTFVAEGLVASSFTWLRGPRRIAWALRALLGRLARRALQATKSDSETSAYPAAAGRVALLALAFATAAAPQLVASAGKGLPSPPSGGGRAGLVFPGVIDAIYDADFEKVPDDQLFRSYLVSVYKGFVDTCGSSGSRDAEKAGQYGIPRLRNPPNPFEVLGQFIQGGVEMRDTGSMASLQRLGQALEPGFVQEGVDDGGAIAQTYQCNSWEVRQFRSRLNQLIDDRRIWEPEADDPQRFLALMHPRYRAIIGDSVEAMVPTRPLRERLTSACLRDSRKGKPFCKCMVDVVLESRIGTELETALIKKFDEPTRERVEEANQAFNVNWQRCRQ